MGVLKKEGGVKPHEEHPSQKRVLDPPSSGTFSTHRNPRRSTPEALLQGSVNSSGGCVASPIRRGAPKKPLVRSSVAQIVTYPQH